MAKLRFGHGPGHVRDTACDAFRAWLDWDGEGAEPTVEYEIQYVPQPISISKACGLVWNCTDIVPGHLVDALIGDGLLDIKRRTYAACARAIHEDVNRRVQQVA
jgi:hypothetical protein